MKVQTLALRNMRLLSSQATELISWGKELSSVDNERDGTGIKVSLYGVFSKSLESISNCQPCYNFG
jgi:hypothetical protein